MTDTPTIRRHENGYLYQHWPEHGVEGPCCECAVPLRNTTGGIYCLSCHQLIPSKKAHRVGPAKAEAVGGTLVIVVAALALGVAFWLPIMSGIDGPRAAEPQYAPISIDLGWTPEGEGRGSNPPTARGRP